jgi:hypothetical protein
MAVVRYIGDAVLDTVKIEKEMGNVYREQSIIT